MKILITGFSGFVSRHFLTFLEDSGIDVEVLGLARHTPMFVFDKYRHVRCHFQQLDLLDGADVEEALLSFRPTHILHLAAYSSVGFSWQRPVESFANNTNISLNVFERVRNVGLPCRILSVGSSEEYGDVSPRDLPLREEAPLRPVSPYGVARVAQEMLSCVYVHSFQQDIVMTRSFNHIGPHQRAAFVIPSLANQLTAICYRGAEARLLTGDRSVVRDFVDVRDVVRAYFSLLLEGKAGEIYNVCSGRGAQIDEVVSLMQQQLGTQATLQVDPKLVRPNDNQAIVGSNDKIKQAVGWAPRYSLEESVHSVLAWARNELP
jgi:GDP-4-dehydro-6-deoxy-D-mannose reductase